jgi:hypothetical protein
MRESIRRGLKYTFASMIPSGPVAQRLEQGTDNLLSKTARNGFKKQLKNLSKIL